MKVLSCFLFKLLLTILTASLVVECHRFGYTRAEQRKWAKKHESCSGRMQSPISIHSNKAIPILMPAIETVRYHNLLPGPLILQNNGHSVSLTIPKTNDDDNETFQMPSVFGGKLDSEYELEGLHYHWGDKNNRGAEHVLNDIRYPLEMHIIHRNKKYKSVAEALGYSDGLTVLGFFYQLKEQDGPELFNIMRNISLLEEMDASVTLDSTFTLASLFGKIDLDRFYTYRGSLTTPPCSEAVTWILFPDTLTVSVSQMAKFRQLSNGIEGSVLVDNFRNVQPMGNRRVFVRKLNSRYTKLELVKRSISHQKWDWYV